MMCLPEPLFKTIPFQREWRRLENLTSLLFVSQMEIRLPASWRKWCEIVLVLTGMAVWVLEAARLADDTLYNCLKEIYTKRHPWLYAVSNLTGLSRFVPEPPLPPSPTRRTLVRPLQALPGTLQELLGHRKVGVSLSAVIIHSLVDYGVIGRALLLLSAFVWCCWCLSSLCSLHKDAPHLDQEETLGQGEKVEPVEIEPAVIWTESEHQH